MVETVNGKVVVSIERWQKVSLEPKLGDNSNAYTGCFTAYRKNKLNINLRKCWVCNIWRTYHVDHKTNETLITQLHLMVTSHGDISWDDREMAGQIHYHHGLLPDNTPDDDTINEATKTMGIIIIGKKQLCCMNHWVLARALLVELQHEQPELAQLPDEFQYTIHDCETCSLFTESIYDTLWSKAQSKSDISSDDDKKNPYQPPYHLSPKEDVEWKCDLGKALCTGGMRLSCCHYGSPVQLESKKDCGLCMCINFQVVDHITRRYLYPLPYSEELVQLLGGLNWLPRIEATSS